MGVSRLYSRPLSQLSLQLELCNFQDWIRVVKLPEGTKGTVTPDPNILQNLVLNLTEIKYECTQVALYNTKHCTTCI